MADDEQVLLPDDPPLDVGSVDGLTDPGPDMDLAPILENDDQVTVPPSLSRSSKQRSFGHRLLGLVAAILGLAGCVASLALALGVLRLSLGAADASQTLMDPLSASVDRLETQVDEIDDLIGRQGVAPEDAEQLVARADGFADLADGWRQNYDAVAEHPVYQWLPVDLDQLDSAITTVETSTKIIANGAATGAESGRVPVAQAEEMSDNVNELQRNFGQVRSTVAEAGNSLTRWIRLGALGGFVASLWSLWAQTWLLRRGWRGLLGRTP